MPASKRNTPPSSGSTYGETDFARMDAYENTAADYEEIPELTDEMIARGVPGYGGDLPKRGRGRSEIEAPDRPIKSSF